MSITPEKPKVKLKAAANTTAPGYGGGWNTASNLPQWYGEVMSRARTGTRSSPGYSGAWGQYLGNTTSDWYNSAYPAFNPASVYGGPLETNTSPYSPPAPYVPGFAYSPQPGTSQATAANTGYATGFAYSPQPVAGTDLLTASEPGGEPLANIDTTTGQPSYEPRYDVDAYGNPTDPYWYQNNNYGQSVLMWDENNQLNGRPGVPEAAVIEARQSLEKWAAEHPGEKWTSTYTPDFYKTQRPDDFNVWGIAGGMGKRNGTTQLRWGTPTPDWVRKVLDKNKDTNKSYDQSQLDQNQPVNLRNIPGWAGDLVSWRT